MLPAAGGTAPVVLSASGRLPGRPMALPPMPTETPQTAPPPASSPWPVASFPVSYYGYAQLDCTLEGGNVVPAAERAVAAVLGGRQRPVSALLSIDVQTGIEIVVSRSKSGEGAAPQRLARIPLGELRSVSRHRDAKHGKPKFLSFIAAAPSAPAGGGRCVLAGESQCDQLGQEMVWVEDFSGSSHQINDAISQLPNTAYSASWCTWTRRPRPQQCARQRPRPVGLMPRRSVHSSSASWKKARLPGCPTRHGWSKSAGHENNNVKGFDFFAGLEGGPHLVGFVRLGY